MRDKFLDVLIQPTGKCDRGCLHCLSNSTMTSPGSFKEEWAKKIAEQAKELGYKTRICITGGGEPLLEKSLPKIIETFVNSKNCYGIDLITSGFTLNNKFEKSQFLKILNKRYGHRVHYFLSFNLYGKDFDERLTTTLETIVKHRKPMIIDIRMALDKRNFRETFEQLDVVLTKLEFKLGIISDPVTFDYSSASFEYFLDVFKNYGQRFSITDMTFFTGDALMIPYIYRMSSKFGRIYIRLSPIFTSPHGRAIQNIPKKALHSFNFSCPVVFQSKDVELLFDECGEVFADCGCSYQKLPIGNIEKDSLKKLLMRRKILSKYLLGKILASKEEAKFSCEMCAKITKEHFNFS